jgi:hypothetical protein
MNASSTPLKMFLYDFAREQSWAPDYWRRILPDLRDLGYREMIFYVETRYHFPRIPQHRPWGGFTPAQAAEAGRLCRRFGLKLYWHTNTFGHCNELLANPHFRHLAEDIGEGEQICPSHPETRPLLRTILREFADLNRERILFVGGDEARALNRDARCRKRGMSDAELYLDHMCWVIRETKRLGKRPCIPGDMLLKFPGLIPEIDRDTVICDWHYDSGSTESIQLFHKHGLEVIALTSSNEYWRNFWPFDQNRKAIGPFMRDARDNRCLGMGMSAWELHRGAHMDNHWERIAGATAAYEDRPLGDFSRRFFGSARADEARLKRFFDEKTVARIHPSLAIPLLRRQFCRSESAYLFYHMFGQGKIRGALREVARRIRAARPVVRDIQRSAKRRRFYLEFLDLPLDLFDVMHDRVEILHAVRATADRLYPHRLPAVAGSRLLRGTVKRLRQHIRKCELLATRYDRLTVTRGGSEVDSYCLRRQIAELRTLTGYVDYHARTYARGVPVPTHELWHV